MDCPARALVRAGCERGAGDASSGIAPERFYWMFERAAPTPVGGNLERPESIRDACANASGVLIVILAVFSFCLSYTGKFGKSVCRLPLNRTAEVVDVQTEGAACGIQCQTVLQLYAIALATFMAFAQWQPGALRSTALIVTALVLVAGCATFLTWESV